MGQTHSGHAEQRFVLHDVSWGAYEALLADQDHHRVRMTYDRGHLELMRPNSLHEWLKALLGRFIHEVTLECDIPVRSGGSTTLRRKSLARGLEPDECYYIQNEAVVRGRSEIGNELDPLPDLVVEIEIAACAFDRMEIYAALGVVEVWRHNGNTLQMFVLAQSGRFREVTRSSKLPIVSVEDVVRFLDRRHETDETSLIREFRQWVRDTLVSEG